MDSNIQITRTEILSLLADIRAGELTHTDYLETVGLIAAREQISTGEVLARTKDILLRGIGHYAAQGGSSGTIGTSIHRH